MQWSAPQSFSRTRRRLHRSAQRSITLVGLTALMGATGLWLTEALVAPQPSQIYTSRLSLFLGREPGEAYSSLIYRAERAARTGAQRSFAQDILMREVVVTVVAEDPSSALPVLILRVSRDQWYRHPDPRRWAFYYSGDPAQRAA
ncbi:hypothetical protein IQ241_01905 [Romeria aff. gracilis LEGE 07310]|uniref:Uncharacterized protein n=1 Tax=Vasconcelosia minhoensis LEGE 07310 TaxID=915328 RepID=A0A8J7DB92_9CYAN|nr:hypothetical protein [Romeria gracilis]MBE9076058.1 hypothetical protein [Romeria aff. gracilis LEGE 07310]